MYVSIHIVDSCATTYATTHARQHTIPINTSKQPISTHLHKALGAVTDVPHSDPTDARVLEVETIRCGVVLV